MQFDHEAPRYLPRGASLSVRPIGGSCRCWWILFTGSANDLRMMSRTRPGWPVAVTTDPAHEHTYGGVNVYNGIAYAEIASYCDGTTVRQLAPAQFRLQPSCRVLGRRVRASRSPRARRRYPAPGPPSAPVARSRPPECGRTSPSVDATPPRTRSIPPASSSVRSTSCSACRRTSAAV